MNKIIRYVGFLPVSLRLYSFMRQFTVRVRMMGAIAVVLGAILVAICYPKLAGEKGLITQYEKADGGSGATTA